MIGNYSAYAMVNSLRMVYSLNYCSVIIIITTQVLLMPYAFIMILDRKLHYSNAMLCTYNIFFDSYYR